METQKSKHTLHAVDLQIRKLFHSIARYFAVAPPLVFAFSLTLFSDFLFSSESKRRRNLQFSKCGGKIYEIFFGALIFCNSLIGIAKLSGFTVKMIILFFLYKYSYILMY